MNVAKIVLLLALMFSPATALAQTPDPIGSAAGPPAAAPPPILREYDGRPIPTTVMVTPPPRKTDRRPYYLMAGLGLIALVYWWNRREKSKLPAGATGAGRDHEGDAERQ